MFIAIENFLQSWVMYGCKVTLTNRKSILKSIFPQGKLEFSGCIILMKGALIKGINLLIKKLQQQVYFK